MRLAKSLNRRAKRIQKFFYLYTSGLNHREIERLLKKDAVDAYTYLKGKTDLTEQLPQRRTVKSFLLVGKEIFISYYCAATHTIAELKPKGMSIGMFENAQFSNRLEEQKIYLKPGDLVLLYSDGVTEATNPDNIMFDVSGLKTVMAESAHESSATLIERINSSLRSFVRSDELQDDATMVAIKVK
jgi:hypothetical protein